MISSKVTRLLSQDSFSALLRCLFLAYIYIIYCSIFGICFASIHATHIETYKLCGDKANATGCLYTCCMCFHVCIYLIYGICVLHIFYMQNQRLNNISGLPKPAARKLVIQKWPHWIPSRERTHIPPNRFPSSRVPNRMGCICWIYPTPRMQPSPPG